MIDTQLQEKIQNLIESKGLNLYDIEVLKENNEILLRISLFKQGGVNLNDCEEITNLISPLLDVELQNVENYFLEVSSPGIERVLKKQNHFKYSINELIEIKMNDKTTLRGILLDYKNDIIEIKKDSKDVLQIPLGECKKVKTIFEWNDKN